MPGRCRETGSQRLLSLKHTTCAHAAWVRRTRCPSAHVHGAGKNGANLTKSDGVCFKVLLDFTVQADKVWLGVAARALVPSVAQ